MSFIYKRPEDVKYSVDIKQTNDKVILSFSADCGKFGTDEQINEFELTVKELLSALQEIPLKHG
jgi:hypothetical protein